jgi:hypothetical protein
VSSSDGLSIPFESIVSISVIALRRGNFESDGTSVKAGPHHSEPSGAHSVNRVWHGLSRATSGGNQVSRGSSA